MKNEIKYKTQKIKFQLFTFIAVDLLLWFLTTLILFEIEYRIFGDNPILETKLFSFLDTVFCAILLVVYIIPLLHFLVKKIDNPIQYLIIGLNEISSGNYNCHLTKKTRNEFDTIFNTFNAMSEKLKEAERQNENNTKERTLLFANMAHDLKTPIAIIQGYSQAILDGMIKDSKKQTEYIETIEKKAHNMNSLVDRLFEYVKLENPQNLMHIEQTDLAEIVRTSIANLYTEFEEHKMSLSIDIPEEKINFAIDKLETSRVISNLLNNILVHNLDGIKVLVKLDFEGKLVIADSGNKIPSHIAEHLFCPFVSGDESRMKKNGSGLGLAITKRIMQKQGGIIEYVKDYPEYTKAFVIKFGKIKKPLFL